MSMQRQPVLIPTKLEKGKDASYKAVERLRENLDTEGVHNIGITGPYGSGKSSVVKTLIKEDENKHHFLELSLATLDDKEAEKDEKKIESNLLKQMIYREKQETLPNSRFRRVQFLSTPSLWWKATWVIACVIAFAIAFEPTFLIIDTLYDFFNLGDLNIWFDALSVLFLLGTLLCVAAYIVRTYGRSKLSKLNISDGEIELKDEGSVLSEHLAEILYFFQETDYDVVVFEDLDRFENKKIFLKLRELNYILNKSKELNGRNIRFIYAVKDDMFKDSSRTKFFDYIVTVIPVMNMSNARSLLKTELVKRGLKEDEICDDDLRVIALFIDDMRMLINIVNEYEQYHERLVTEQQKLEARKLLAAVVYKNYNPKDFSDLHNQRGKVYRCIKEKNRFAKYAIEKVLGQREKDIKVMEQNMHLSLKELRQIYVQAIIQNVNSLNGVKTISIGNKNLQPKDIWEKEEYYNQLIAKGELAYTTYGYGNTPTHRFDFKEIEKSVSEVPYAERVKAVRDRYSDIDRKKDELEKEKGRIRNYFLSELIIKFNLGDEEIYKKIGLSPMADLFLSRGLIAEDYYDYISYFYAGMITQSDRELLLDMNRNVKSDFDRHIDKVENFFRELPSFVFNTDAVLNTCLVDYVAKEFIWLKNEFNLIIDRMKRHEGRLDFLVHYYEHGQYVERVCKAYMNGYAKDAWQDMIATMLVSDERREELLEVWFRYCVASDITQVQVNWLNEHYSFLSAREDRIANLEIIFGECEFETLDDKSEKLLLMAIDNDAYMITAENLCVIYRQLSGIMGIQPTEITYGKLIGLQNDGLTKYLKQNINDVLTECTNPMKDESEETIIELLNNEEIEDEILEAYLKGQMNFVSDLSEVGDARIGLAIDCDVVKMIWPNVLHYYNINKLNDRLTKFIVRYAKGLSENRCEGDGTLNLYSAIVAKKEIPLAEFKLLIGSFNYYVGLDDSVDWENYDREKLIALIDEGAIEYDAEEKKILGGTSAFAYYLTHYKADFMAELDKVALGTSDVKELFAGKDFTLDEKLKIVDAIDEEIIDGELADVICGMLREKWIDVESSKLKWISRETTVVENKVFAATLYIGKNIGYKDRIEAVLGAMPSPYNQILTGARPKIEKTADNESLIKLLETGGYISKKPVEKDGKEYLRTFMKEKG